MIISTLRLMFTAILQIAVTNHILFIKSNGVADYKTQREEMIK